MIYEDNRAISGNQTLVFWTLFNSIKKPCPMIGEVKRYQGGNAKLPKSFPRHEKMFPVVGLSNSQLKHSDCALCNVLTLSRSFYVPLSCLNSYHDQIELN